MRLSALNIWGSFTSRRAQQQAEVIANALHSKMIWRDWEHTGWGDAIRLTPTKELTMKVNGHTTPLPGLGDELQVKMKSGKIGRYRFSKIDYCIDPSDMWFGEVRWIGYLEDA